MKEGMYSHSSGLILTGGHSLLVDYLTNQEQQDTLKYWNQCRKVDNKYLLLTCINNKFKRICDLKLYTTYHLVLEGENEIENIILDGMSLSFYQSIK